MTTTMINKNNLEYKHKCSRCLVVKPNSEYTTVPSRKGKRQYAAYCKVCSAEYGRKNGYSAKAGKRRRELNPLSYLYYSSMSNTYRKSKLFTITIKDLEEALLAQKGLCYYTGRVLNMTLGFQDSVSVDRKDSKLGYVPGNVVLCTWQVNRMKSDTTIQELVTFCQDILNNLKNKQ